MYVRIAILSIFQLFVIAVGSGVRCFLCPCYVVSYQWEPWEVLSFGFYSLQGLDFRNTRVLLANSGKSRCVDIYYNSFGKACGFHQKPICLRFLEND